MILARTALEKVKRHVKERKEKTIFNWVRTETQEFIRKFSKDKELSDCISKISYGLQNQDYNSIENAVDICIQTLSQKINRLYLELMEENK